MIIITDCLNGFDDEGASKVAVKLIEKIKERDKSHLVLTYGEGNGKGDLHANVNKLFLGNKLKKYIDGNVLYIPRATNTLASAFRIYRLSKMAKGKLKVLFTITYGMNKITASLIEKSNAEIIVLDNGVKSQLESQIKNKITYVKLGVDINKFSPVNKQEKIKLRIERGFNVNDKILIHVGHLRRGRNAHKLLSLTDEYKVIFVASTFTERDKEIEEEFLKNKNVTLITEYVKDIQNLYRLSDVFVFPVEEEFNSIDSPLSVLEAMACNLRVVATPYKNLKNIVCEGFEFLNCLEKQDMTLAIESVLTKGVNTREVAKEYQWENAVNVIL